MMLVPSVNKSCLLLLLFLLVTVFPAWSYDLIGLWTYRQSGGDNQDTVTTFQQRYQLGVDPSLAWRPTRAISVSGGVGYRQTQQTNSNTNTTTTVEQISPYGSFSLTNDIFLFNLNGNSYTTISGTENSTSYWNMSLRSAWALPYWPSLSFNYGEDYEGVDKVALFDATNGKSTNTNVSVDWDLEVANLLYQYSINKAISGEGDPQSEVNSHYVRFDTSGHFWDDRVNLGLVQQYRTSKLTNYNADADIDSGRELIEGQSTQSYRDPGGATGGNPNSNLIPDPLPAGLPGVPVDQNDYIFIELGYLGEEQIDTVSVYLNDPFDLLITSAVESLRWDVWVRDDGSPDWVQTATGLPFVFRNQNIATNQKLFEVEVDVRADEIMLVCQNTISSSLSFNRVLSYLVLVRDGGDSTVTSYNTNFSSNYRISRTVNANFGLNYDHYETEPVTGTAIERDKISYTGVLTWIPSVYFAPSVSYNEYHEEATDELDRETRQYNVQISTRPMSTLGFTLGYSRIDRYTGDVTVYTSDSYAVTTRASLYPDLTASMTASYSEAERLPSGVEEGVESILVERNTSALRLDVLAKLYEDLNAYLSAYYNRASDEIDGTSEDINATLRLNYRPSDRLNAQLSYTRYYLDSSDRSDILDLTTEVYLVRTRKARLSVALRHTEAEETSESLKMIGSWSISRYFSLTTNASARFGDIDSYVFNVNLAMRL